jgi:hypothetical protein
MWGALAPGAWVRRGAVLVSAVVALAGTAAYAVAYSQSERERVKIQDPCHADRDLPDTGGITGFLQDETLQRMDEVACDIGAGREELLLAFFDDELGEKFKEDHGVDLSDFETRVRLGLGALF